LLWAVLFVGLVATMWRQVVLYDEGIILTGAARVLDGEVVHRDFYASYAPGQFHVVAGLFALFGPSVLVLRLYDLAVRAAILVLVHVVLRRRYGRRIAWAGMLPCVPWMISGTHYGYPVFPCLLLALLGCMALCGGSVGDRRHLFAAGAAAGAVAYFRYDVGAAVALAYALSLGLEARAEGRPWRAAWRELARFGSGTAVVVVALMLWLWSVGALGAAASDLAWQAVYPRMRSHPFPDAVAIAVHPEAVAVYVPLVALAGAVAIALGRRRLGAPPADRLVLHLWPLTVAFAAKAWVIPSVIHMVMALVTATMLSVALLAERRARPAALLLALVVAAAAVVVLVRRVGETIEYPRFSGVGWIAEIAGWRERDDFQRPGCPPLVRLDPGMLHEDYVRMTQLLKAVSDPAERVLITNARHDRGWSNAIALYFLAERQPCTRWHQFDPGVTTTREVQQAVIADVEAARVRWLLVDAILFDYVSPGESGVSSGVHDLDEYLLAHYRPVAFAGGMSVWAAKRIDAAEVEAILERAKDCR
jgi:hypothetical protein